MEVREPVAKYLARPAFKQTEVGLIPEDWECSAIGSLIDLLTGFPFPSKGYVSSGIRLLRGSNIKRGNTDWNDELTAYWPSVSADIRKYALSVGDIVIAMDGSLVGRSFASLSGIDVPSLLLQRVARIRSGKVAQGYLKAWICSPRFTEHCDAVKTTTAIPHISPGDIRSFQVGVPPTLAEQQAIAEVLSDADALIEALEQLLAKQRQIKQGAMQELLTGQKRLPGFGGEWVRSALGNVAPLQRGFDLPNGKLRPGPYPVVYSNGVLHYHKECQARGPGVITGRSGTIGTVTYVEQDYWPHNTSLWVTSFKGNDPKYVFYLYTSIGLERFATGSGVPTLNRNDVHAFHVILPPTREEQTAIAAVLSDMDAEIAAVEAKLAKARAVKQGMMQELLTGRIRLV